MEEKEFDLGMSRGGHTLESFDNNDNNFGFTNCPANNPPAKCSISVIISYSILVCQIVFWSLSASLIFPSFNNLPTIISNIDGSGPGDTSLSLRGLFFVQRSNFH